MPQDADVADVQKSMKKAAFVALVQRKQRDLDAAKREIIAALSALDTLKTGKLKTSDIKHVRRRRRRRCRRRRRRRCRRLVPHAAPARCCVRLVSPIII